VADSIATFDLMQSGQLLPNVAEQRVITVKAAHFPRDGLEFQQMLGSPSLFVVDVLQGDQHPHARAFRRFVRTDVPIIQQAALRNMDPVTVVEEMGNYYPTIMRAVQIAMVSYWSELLDRLDPMLPDYGHIIRRSVVSRALHLFFTAVPCSYFQAPPTAAVSAPSTDGGGRVSAPSNRTNTDR
jgi:hypothetical protein